MRRRTTWAVLAATAALTLSGCAGLRPGVAAEIGDHEITTRDLDAFTKGLCAYNRGNDAPPSATVDLRLSALRALIVADLAHKFAEDNDLRVSRSDIDSTMAQVGETVVGLSDEERDEFLEQARYTVEGDDYTRQAVVALVQAAGEELSNETGTAAQATLLKEWSDDAGVEVDPRFGSWASGDLSFGSGSLSVTDNARLPTPPDTPTDGLPVSQTCG